MFYQIKGNKNYILFFACVATALVTVDLACISVALPKMLGYFSASKIEIAWVITVYSISEISLLFGCITNLPVPIPSIFTPINSIKLHKLRINLGGEYRIY